MNHTLYTVSSTWPISIDPLIKQWMLFLETIGEMGRNRPPPPPPPHVHTHCTYGTCGVLHCLLFCDQTRPNLRISLVGYHCAIEFPCGVPLFYCCKYPTTYGVRIHPVVFYGQIYKIPFHCFHLMLNFITFFIKHAQLDLYTRHNRGYYIPTFPIFLSQYYNASHRAYTPSKW